MKSFTQEYSQELMFSQDEELKHCKDGLKDRTFLKLGKESAGDRRVISYSVTLKCNWRERKTKTKNKKTKKNTPVTHAEKNPRTQSGMTERFPQTLTL